MARPRSLALLLGTAFGFMAVGCHRGPKPVYVSSVHVNEGALAAQSMDPGLDVHVLERTTLSSLQAAGFRSGAGERTYRASLAVVGVQLAPPELPTTGPRVEVEVEITLEPEKDPSLPLLREAGSGIAPVGTLGPGLAFRQAFSNGARDAAEGLALGLAADEKPLDKVLADLGSPDPRVRDHAVRALADRHNPEALPALVLRLEDADSDVVQRAVGALAQVGDPRAVSPLIDLAERSDAEFSSRILRVIGDLGGPEAEAYLGTVEAGHPDPRLRRAAKEALRDLRSRDVGTALNQDH